MSAPNELGELDSQQWRELCECASRLEKTLMGGGTSVDLRRFLPAAQAPRHGQQRSITAQNENEIGVDGGQVVFAIGLDSDDAGALRDPRPPLFQRPRDRELSRVGDNEHPLHAGVILRVRPPDGYCYPRSWAGKNLLDRLHQWRDIGRYYLPNNVEVDIEVTVDQTVAGGGGGGGVGHGLVERSTKTITAG